MTTATVQLTKAQLECLISALHYTVTDLVTEGAHDDALAPFRALYVSLDLLSSAMPAEPDSDDNWEHDPGNEIERRVNGVISRAVHYADVDSIPI